MCSHVIIILTNSGDARSVFVSYSVFVSFIMLYFAVHNIS